VFVPDLILTKIRYQSIESFFALTRMKYKRFSDVTAAGKKMPAGFIQPANA